jgi:hypothetical protein
MKMGQYIGLQDQLFHDIHVGDLLKDAKGAEYTVDRFGRAKPLDGGNELPVRKLTGCEVVSEWKPAPSEEPAVKTKAAPEPEPEMNDEEKAIHAMYEGVDAAGDQMLVDQLRKRGYTVTCTKVVERVVYEEVSL